MQQRSGGVVLPPRASCAGAFLVFLVAIFWAATSTNAQTTRITIGHTSGLTGRISKEAQQLRSGLEAAFAEANDTNILRGVTFSIIPYDDGYDQANISRIVDAFLYTDNVMAILGSMGTLITTELVRQLDLRGNSNVPIIAPWSGSDSLRTPFQRNIIHARAGFFDETAAIVDWMTAGSNFFTKISVFHQVDGFGTSGVRGIVAALGEIGLAVYSSASYTRGSLDFDQAIDEILSPVVPGKPETAPEIVGIFALPLEAVKFIWQLKQDPRSRNDTCFLLLSIVSPDVFFDVWETHPEWRFPLEGIFTTQVVPNPLDTSFELVRNYQAAVSRYFPSYNFTYAGLEGYLDGRFFIELIGRIRGNITAASIINAAYQGKYFTVDDILLGPYGDTRDFNCSQGSHDVYFLQLLPSKTTQEITTARFSWPREQCSSTSDNIVRPIFFGQSAALTGPSKQLGIPYRTGLVAAFERFNRLGGLDGRPVHLLTLDDSYEPARSTENTKTLLDYQPMGLIGWSGTAVAQAAIQQSIPARVPFFCPFTGALEGLRDPCSKYVIHTRVSYYDEAAAHVAWLYDTLGLRRISVFYQDDGFGQAGFLGVKRALEFRGTDVYTSGSHPRNSLEIEAGFSSIMSGSQPPQAVVLFVIYDPAAAYLARAGQDSRARSLVYIAPSVVNTDELLRSLSVVGSFKPTLYITQVFPNPADTKFDIVREYQEALAESSFSAATPSFLGLEGYMAGRLATRALQLVSGPLTPESLTNTIYEHPLFFFGGLKLGPFVLNSTSNSLRDPNRNVNTSQCLCNQGGHEVYLTQVTTNSSGGYLVDTVESFSFSFETCGLRFPVYVVDSLSPGVKIFMQALSGISALICTACAIGVFIFRETKTMRSSSPFFLCLILVGGIFMSMSPILAAEYYSNNLPTVKDLVRSDPYLFVIWYWFIGVGFQLMFATIAVKTFRVDKIFNSLQFIEKVIIIKEQDLIIYLSIPFMLELALLVLWTSLSYPTCVRTANPSNPLILVDICSGKNDMPFLIVQAILFAVVAASGCYFAFKTRNIRYGSFNESKEILFVVYNLVVVCVVLIPLNAGFIFSTLISAMIRSVGVIFLVLVSIGTLFGGKFYRILIHKEGLSTDSPHQTWGAGGTQLSLGPVASYFQSGYETSPTHESSSGLRQSPSTDDTEASSWEPPPSPPRKFWHQDDGNTQESSSSSPSDYQSKPPQSSPSTSDGSNDSASESFDGSDQSNSL
eukprot:TRINITY_DN2263_c0_g1_i1.p1 TRINITY_DN2263_c0_g1~~TRINITY_DN2263_c0_g1_i1.p1  ORF type:complete len:1235 (-),score=187.24 TRINITY_DN2263_c0_g1_i1:8-3712(-)